MMDKMKIEEIFSDKEFVKELVALKDNAAVQAALKAKGLDLTEEKIAAIRERMAKKSGELSGEQLEQVSGGFGGAYSSMAAGERDPLDDIVAVAKEELVNILVDLFTW